MSPLRAACVIALAILSTACIDGTEKITLNPDGSGKAVMDLHMNPAALDLMNDDAAKAQPPLAMARLTAMMMIENLEGIDAWADVSVEADKDGWAHFKGTAYFKNIDAFEPVPNFSDVQKFTWAKDPAGGMALTLSMPKPPGQPKLTDDQVVQAVKTARAEWAAQTKSQEFAQVSKFKLLATFLLPGKVDQAVIFENAPGGVTLSSDGKKFIDGWAKLINDDAALTAAIKTNGGFGNEATLLPALFGKNGPVRARVAGDLKPAFDYVSEMEAAKKAQPEMIKKAGLTDQVVKAPSLTPATIPSSQPMN